MGEECVQRVFPEWRRCSPVTFSFRQDPGCTEMFPLSNLVVNMISSQILMSHISCVPLFARRMSHATLRTACLIQHAAGVQFPSTLGADPKTQTVRTVLPQWRV